MEKEWWSGHNALWEELLLTTAISDTSPAKTSPLWRNPYSLSGALFRGIFSLPQSTYLWDSLLFKVLSLLAGSFDSQGILQIHRSSHQNNSSPISGSSVWWWGTRGAKLKGVSARLVGSSGSCLSNFHVYPNSHSWNNKMGEGGMFV